MAISNLFRAGAIGFLLALCACAQAETKAPAATTQTQDGVHREEVVVETARGPLTFWAEIADDEQERTRGLMFRREMARDHGMLFEFPEPEMQSFWMRNTHLSLDLIFIGADGRIINIAANATPYSDAGIPSTAPATGVLEINAGLAQELGIAPGDRVRHPHFPTN